jgi:hypothetical protein
LRNGRFSDDGHVAVQEEGEAAEHLLLGDRVLAGEQLAQAVDETLVVGQG